MKNYIQSGQNKTFTADADYLSGAVVVVGDQVGVNSFDVLTGEEGEMALTGVFTLPKEAPLVIADGDVVYFDTTLKEIDKTGTNELAGTAFKAALSADTTVQVLLKGGSRAVN